MNGATPNEFVWIPSLVVEAATHVLNRIQELTPDNFVSGGNAKIVTTLAEAYDSQAGTNWTGAGAPEALGLLRRYIGSLYVPILDIKHIIDIEPTMEAHEMSGCHIRAPVQKTVTAVRLSISLLPVRVCCCSLPSLSSSCLSKVSHKDILEYLCWFAQQLARSKLFPHSKGRSKVNLIASSLEPCITQRALWRVRLILAHLLSADRFIGRTISTRFECFAFRQLRRLTLNSLWKTI